MGAIRAMTVTTACQDQLHLWCAGRNGAKARGRVCTCVCHYGLPDRKHRAEVAS